MPTNQHEDFGEKIGGAKKDLWRDRGLYVDDLNSMNDREAEKYVKKDNIWKKPNYQAICSMVTYSLDQSYLSRLSVQSGDHSRSNHSA